MATIELHSLDQQGAVLTVAGVEQKTGKSKAISANSSHASSSEALHLRGLQEDLHIWSTREVQTVG